MGYIDPIPAFNLLQELEIKNLWLARRRTRITGIRAPLSPHFAPQPPHFSFLHRYKSSRDTPKCPSGGFCCNAINLKNTNVKEDKKYHEARWWLGVVVDGVHCRGRKKQKPTTSCNGTTGRHSPPSQVCASAGGQAVHVESRDAP